MILTLNVKIKRVYDPPDDSDGVRILVDRLWPRGLKRVDAYIDVWAKEWAPSALLRTWFAHEESKFSEFRKRYLKELRNRNDEVHYILRQAVGQQITLLSAVQNLECSHTSILRDYLLANTNSV